MPHYECKSCWHSEIVKKVFTVSQRLALSAGIYDLGGRAMIFLGPSTATVHVYGTLTPCLSYSVIKVGKHIQYIHMYKVNI